MERVPFEQLKALRVIDLRKMLTDLGLSQSGVKAELVARLDSYYESMEGSAQQEEVGVESNENSSEAQEMVDEEEEVEEQIEEVDEQMEDEEEQVEDEEEQIEDQEAENDDEINDESNDGNVEEQPSEEEEQEQEDAAQAQKEEEEEAERQRVLQAEQQRAEQEQLRLEAQQKAQEAEKQRLLLEKQKREEQERQALIEAQRKAEEWKAERQRELLAKQEEEKRLKIEEAEKQRILLAEQEQQRLKNEEAEKQQAYLAKYEEQKRLQQEKAQQEAEAAKQRQLETEKLHQQEIEAEKQKNLFKHQISPKAQMGSLAGPPPDMDDLEASPKKGTPVPLMSLMVEAPETSGEKTALPAAASRDVKLPQGLEEVLAFKSKWATQQGHQPSDIARVEREGVVFQTNQMQQAEVKKIPNVQKPVQLVESMDDDDKSKGKKKNKKKKKKKNRPEEWARQAAEAERRRQEAEEAAKEAENTADVEVEYIQEKLDLDMSDPAYRQFSRIFEAFKIQDADDEGATIAKAAIAETSVHNEELKKVPKLLEDDDMIEENDDDAEGDDGEKKLSKRKLKKLNRLSVAELKQLVTRPDVVEMHDVTAKDPGLLVHLKSIRNTVPVPRHWCFKRKYLQGKRGIEKPPFDLPEFIKKTGIMEMRAALQEKEEAKGMKSKMREKVRPKLGKIDIDYQKLHDAFFKWQTKPRMTYHGDLYYEGKEFEIRLKEKKPGDLTDDLRTALGMPVGPNAHKVPPPWLISMQRYGPPPSYPNLKIPGLNAPIPEGCSFGYHAGGWGKPPVDETGKPLYGDVFGTSDTGYSQQVPVEEVDQTLWGEMESESEEEESEEEEEEEEEMEEAADASGMQTPIVDAGMATPSGMSSVGAPGQETPELIELRKRRIEADMEGGETPNLYTILPEKKNDRIGAGMMGSTHTYDLPSAMPPGGGAKRLDPGAVEMALNPDEVDLIDSEALQAKAEAAMREKQASLASEDLSDMVAEHAAKQSNKRKRQANKGEESKSNKKYKEFKF